MLKLVMKTATIELEGEARHPGTYLHASVGHLDGRSGITSPLLTPRPRCHCPPCAARWCACSPCPCACSPCSCVRCACSSTWTPRSAGAVEKSFDSTSSSERSAPPPPLSSRSSCSRGSIGMKLEATSAHQSVHAPCSPCPISSTMTGTMTRQPQRPARFLLAAFLLCAPSLRGSA